MEHGAVGQRRGRLAFIASSSGSTFEAAVHAGRAGELDAEVVLLITSRVGVGAADRAKRLTVESLILDEKLLGAEVCDGRMAAVLLEREIDLIVLAGFLRKIGPQTLAGFAGRIINTHPAPLPRFGGKQMYGDNVHRAVLASGVATSAATIHWADAEYDRGPVIATEEVPVWRSDGVPELRARVQAAEKQLLVRSVNSLLPDILKRCA